MISTIYARSRDGALYVRAIIKQEEKHCLHLRFVGHWIYELYLVVKYEYISLYDNGKLHYIFGELKYGYTSSSSKSFLILL